MDERSVAAVRIGLHDVAGLRWPEQPLTGDGARVDTAVPLPRLPWSRAAIQIPLGASAARDIARITRLRRIFGYGVGTPYVSGGQLGIPAARPGATLSRNSSS